MTTSAKSFAILSTGFRGDVLKSLTYIHVNKGNWPHPLVAMLFDGSNLFKLFL